MVQLTDLPRIVALACHDLRTPLAAIHGFARTLERAGELEATQARYVGMIVAASEELGDIVDDLSLVGRLESGRYEATLQTVDSRRVAERAAELVGDDSVDVGGTGESVDVDVAATERAVAALAEAARRHGGLERVRIDVAGRVLRLSPVAESAAAVVLGENLRDLGAAAARALIEALGGSVSHEGDVVAVRLPA